MRLKCLSKVGLRIACRLSNRTISKASVSSSISVLDYGCHELYGCSVNVEVAQYISYAYYQFLVN